MSDVNTANKTPELDAVNQAVLDEIKSFGEDNKKNYNELRKNHEELKKEFEKNSNVLTEEKISKLQEDILTRQEALDKKESANQKRFDDLELAFKRGGQKGSDKHDEGFLKDATTFKKHVESVRGKSINFDQVVEGNVEEYKQYGQLFDKYMRRYGGNNNLSMTPDEQKTMLVGSDPDGGYTVPVAMGNKIIERLYEIDPVRQLASIETISGDAIEWLQDADEAGAEWESETVATTDESTPNLNKVKIATHSLATRPKVTQKLLEDSSINIESWLGKKVADKFARTEGQTFIDGDGIGKPRGILTYTSGTSWGQIEQVNMGAAATITADGFIDVKYSLIEQYLNRGTWLMQRSTVAETMKLKDGTGNYIWKPSMIANDPSSTILGLPVRMSPNVPTIAANALSVILADWKESYMIVDRIGITVLRNPYTHQPLVQFYFRKRVGGGVINYQSVKIGKIAV